MPESVSQFAFIQVEFPWVLGPADGRYVVRTEAGRPPAHVLVVQTLASRQRHRIGGRRSRRAEPEPEPSPVSTTRATVITADPLGDSATAQSWLEGIDTEEQAGQALAVINRAIAAYRIAAADPLGRDVAAEQALVVRAGYGPGEEVADGRWAQARELRLGRSRRKGREAALRPQERVAGLLGARDHALACEELALLARQALDGGRPREAALVLDAALGAAVVELVDSRPKSGMPARLTDLSERRPGVSSAASAGLRRSVAAAGEPQVREALERLEAALRSRAAAGPEESA